MILRNRDGTPQTFHHRALEPTFHYYSVPTYCDNRCKVRPFPPAVSQLTGYCEVTSYDLNPRQKWRAQLEKAASARAKIARLMGPWGRSFSPWPPGCETMCEMG